MATINLKFAANCKDCGAYLPVGTKARWYRKSGTFGIGCHEKDGTINEGFDRTTIAEGAPKRRTPQSRAPWAGASDERESMGMRASRMDPTGFYAADGTLIGRTNARGRCEDAPCCGCCT